MENLCKPKATSGLRLTISADTDIESTLRNLTLFVLTTNYNKVELKAPRYMLF